MSHYQCDRCGACCQGHLIVEVYDIDVLREPRLATHSSPAESLTPQDWHIVQGVMADLQEEGRCLILAGGLTRPCTFLQDDQACGVYPTRPNACVAMEAGDEQCQSSRAAAGLPPLMPTEDEFSAD